MNEHEQHHRKHHEGTPPSKAVGESGDREARREAEDAVMPGSQDGEAGDALTPNTDAQRRTARRDSRH
ncbi:hypothetical protein WDV06_27140 [Streptomyces racemochromogenes]|uniref:Uncharacterized protein n=1 Tax=Streptomyces racemochromogenes TaxID=67353 RepID=A0ABW7PKS6_9ACTN